MRSFLCVIALPEVDKHEINSVIVEEGFTTILNGISEDMDTHTNLELMAKALRLIQSLRTDIIDADFMQGIDTLTEAMDLENTPGTKAKAAWDKIVTEAERPNSPGIFTLFVSVNSLTSQRQIIGPRPGGGPAMTTTDD